MTECKFENIGWSNIPCAYKTDTDGLIHAWLYIYLLHLLGKIYQESLQGYV